MRTHSRGSHSWGVRVHDHDGEPGVHRFTWEHNGHFPAVASARDLSGQQGAGVGVGCGETPFLPHWNHSRRSLSRSVNHTSCVCQQGHQPQSLDLAFQAVPPGYHIDSCSNHRGMGSYFSVTFFQTCCELIISSLWVASGYSRPGLYTGMGLLSGRTFHSALRATHRLYLKPYFFFFFLFCLVAPGTRETTQLRRNIWVNSAFICRASRDSSSRGHIQEPTSLVLTPW